MWLFVNWGKLFSFNFNFSLVDNWQKHICCGLSCEKQIHYLLPVFLGKASQNPLLIYGVPAEAPSKGIQFLGALCSCARAFISVWAPRILILSENVAHHKQATG